MDQFSIFTLLTIFFGLLIVSAFFFSWHVESEVDTDATGDDPEAERVRRTLLAMEIIADSLVFDTKTSVEQVFSARKPMVRRQFL